MRLTDLDPHWSRAGEGRHGMGVTFRCPGHPGDPGAPSCETRLSVWFANPLDGGEPYRWTRADGGPGPLWHRMGETFDTMTLTPSVDAGEQGHWHGFIVSGRVT